MEELLPVTKKLACFLILGLFIVVCVAPAADAKAKAKPKLSKKALAIRANYARLDDQKSERKTWAIEGAMLKDAFEASGALLKPMKAKKWKAWFVAQKKWYGALVDLKTAHAHHRKALLDGKYTKGQFKAWKFARKRLGQLEWAHKRMYQAYKGKKYAQIPRLDKARHKKLVSFASAYRFQGKLLKGIPKKFKKKETAKKKTPAKKRAKKAVKK